MGNGLMTREQFDDKNEKRGMANLTEEGYGSLNLLMLATCLLGCVKCNLGFGLTEHDGMDYWCHCHRGFGA